MIAKQSYDHEKYEIPGSFFYSSLLATTSTVQHFLSANREGRAATHRLWEVAAAAGQKLPCPPLSAQQRGICPGTELRSPFQRESLLTGEVPGSGQNYLLAITV